MANKGQNPPVALVTGGSRRIGLAVSEGLAAAGFAVAIHYNASADEAESAALRLRSDGGPGRAEAFGCDLADAEQVRELVPRVAAAMGPVRLLVNNASVFRDDGPEEAGGEIWREHFAVHVQAPSMLASAMADGLPRGERGLVVNMVDQRVRRLNPRFHSYTLSKSAMWTATQTLAQRLAPLVRVNAIGPGPTLPSPRQTSESFRAQVDPLLLGRGPKLGEFARTILWMWQTPSFTGQLVNLDGGQHLAWETPDATVEE